MPFDPSVENIEPEIERLLTIPRMVPPSKDALKGYIHVDDLKELSSASAMEQKHWLFSSALEQAVDMMVIQVQKHNYFLRQLEAEMIRNRLRKVREDEEERGMKLFWRLARWIALIAGGVAVTYFAQKWLPNLFGRP